MAITYTVADQNTNVNNLLESNGSHRERYVTLSANSGGTYTTGGDNILASAFQMARVNTADFEIDTPGTTAAGSVVALPQSNGSINIKLNNVALTGEQTAGSNETGLVVRGIVRGYA